tara:strand:- start:478 stop:1083 length:606 start_codon:yes stop_codon:yes gene_type:complete
MANMTTLQQSLINAKKVMGKVDAGNFSKGNVSLSQANLTDSSGLMSQPPQQQIPQSLPSVDMASGRQDLSPKKNLTEDRINSSRLPDAIKKAMIDNPIPDIPFNGGGVGLTEEFLSGVQEQMSKQGLTSSEQQVTQQVPQPTTTKSTKKITSKNLKSIIKESVKELLNETIGLKKDADENFQFRVGDKIFYGKITSSKTVK